MTVAQWIGLFFLGAMLALLWQLRNLLLLIFGAIVIAVALDTLSRIPQRFGLRRGSSLVLTILTVMVGASILMLIVVPPLVNQFIALFNQLREILLEAPAGFEQGFENIRDWLDNFSPIPLAEEPTEGSLPPPISPSSPIQFDPNTIIETVLEQLGRGLGIATSFVTVVINLFLLTILTILLLVDPKSYVNAFVLICPDFYRDRIRYILHRCEEALRSWLIGILITSTFVMLMSGIGLLILGVPLVLANAVLAGIFNFIPNIGPTLSVIAPMTLALSVDPWKALWVLFFYVGIQNLETYAVTPYVMSRQVSLLPGLTLLAQVVFTTFFGLPGLLLAVPSAAVLQVWIQEVLIHDVLDHWTAPPLLMSLSKQLQLPRPSEPTSPPATAALSTSEASSSRETASDGIQEDPTVPEQT